MLVLLSAIAVAFSVASQVAPVRVKNSAVEATKQEMDALRLALLDYYRDNAAFPDSLARLVGNPPPPVATWNGPYIRATSTLDDYAKDGWGNPYQYAHTPGALGADVAQLYSIGPDQVDGTLGTGSDDLPAQGADGRIGAAESRREVERLAQAELAVIQQAAQQYLIREGAFPPNIEQLYSRHYLYDNSYHDDPWGRRYEVAGSQFYSRGPNVDTSDDDIYPFSPAAGSGATYHITQPQDGDFGVGFNPPEGDQYCRALWPGSGMATATQLTACVDAHSCSPTTTYWRMNPLSTFSFPCTNSGASWQFNIAPFTGLAYRGGSLFTQTCNQLAPVVCVEP